eukprot:616454-Amphidinium_carterae.2
MASGIALAVAVLFATAGVAATIREELFAASSLATCEARAEQLQLALLESQQYAAELRSLLAEYQAKHHKLPAKPTNFKAPSARSLVEMAAEEGVGGRLFPTRCEEARGSSLGASSSHSRDDGCTSSRGADIRL